MTCTYDITNTVGKIRLIIGDKDCAVNIFEDEELTAFYTMEGSINLGAAAALEAWAATHAANADNEKIGDYSYAQNIVTKMLSLAKSLRDKEASAPAMTWASFNLTDAEKSDEL